MARTIVALFLSLSAWTTIAVSAAEQPLIELGKDFDLKKVEARDVMLSLEDGMLHLATGHTANWPGITIKAPGGVWNLERAAQVAIELTNTGNNDIEAHAKLESSNGKDWSESPTAHLALKPGTSGTLVVPIVGKMPAELKPKLFAMRGYPGGWQDQGLAADKVVQLVVFVDRPKVDHAFAIRSITKHGTRDTGVVDPAKFFPMIDAFGQYIHKDWPGKTHSQEDLLKARTAEAEQLKTDAGPKDWDQFGGWLAGPKLKATGFFRTEKIDGRWWLVDPEGRLFWSHGIDCVGTAQCVTPITDREFYFADLPGKDSPFAQFYGTGNWAPHNYYEGRGEYRTYNFQGANLLRKYGNDWQKTFAGVVHQRLRSWGLNTIGNWSDRSIYGLRKTPYTATVGVRGRSREIEGSNGYWGKFSDVFDPLFEAAIRRGMAEEKERSAGDPWCLGYFVDNELSWGDEDMLALGTLCSPADQAAKKVFLADLKKKYESIDRLNAAWGTKHASWDALLENREAPDKLKAHEDLVAFSGHVADRYFEICRNAVKEVAPDQLYLGCRFAWTFQGAIRAGAKYCDVVSFNFYRRSIADEKLPEGCDKPTIIGEFHFGALDRGMFHTGLVPTSSQQERAAAYQEYVRGALCNPQIVGTHWFQYSDQATTGRGDGENYQIGFVDCCDTPYPETTAASRETADGMYPLRSGK